MSALQLLIGIHRGVVCIDMNGNNKLLVAEQDRDIMWIVF